MNVAHLLISQARQRTNAPALIEPRGNSDRTITFAQLDEQSARCAKVLLEAGIEIDDHVLVFVPMSIDLYLALIAIFRIGAVATFLDPSAGKSHINRCCEMIRPTAMIAITRAHLLRFSSAAIRKINRKFTVGAPIPFTSRWESARISAPMNDITPRQKSDPALVTFTSGSTGLPKGAVRSHGFLAAQHAALSRAIDLTAGEIDLATLAIFSLANLASGVTSVFPAADLQHPGAIDPGPVMKQIARHKITRCVASPAFFERLLSDPNAAESMRTINRIYTGGAPVFPGLMDRMSRVVPGASITAVYGSTEAEPIADLSHQDISEKDHQAMKNGAGLLAGKVVADIQLRIISNQWGRPLAPAGPAEFTKAILPAGQIGEIIVHGDHVLSGYLNGQGDEQTKLRVGESIWHRTGDAGYLDSMGRLWLVGRAEAAITDENGTVYPFAVECAASGIAGVERSALIRNLGKRWLVVQPSVNARLDLQSILLRDLAWARVDQIKLLPKIPVDKRHNAKIDYPALRQLLGINA
jgi:acyl-CoA synthetase (AMP-forming)/AMP-acid ligase II